MEDKNLTPQESMAVITQMIEATKQRIAVPDLRISVMWAILTIAIATIVLIVSLICYTPWINLLWLAIPVIGLPASFIFEKKSKPTHAAKTAIDKISEGNWRIVSYVSIALAVICFIFNIFGYPQAWLAMFFFAFIIVGFAAAVQGVIIKENSYLFGGLFSILVGFVLIGLKICNIPLLIVWIIPLYILCFLLMFIVPAYIIRKKLNSAKQ